MTVDGYFPGPNPPDPVLTAPDAVFVRVGLLEAVAEKAAEYKRRREQSYEALPGEGYYATEHRIREHVREALAALDAALAAAGATDQGGGT